MSLVAPWVTPDDLPTARPTLPTLPSDDSDATVAQTAAWGRLCLVASEVLYARTARRWGGSVERIVELHPAQRRWILGAPPIFQGWVGGSWGSWGGLGILDLAWADIVGACGCGACGLGPTCLPSAIRLPDYPVRAVSLVVDHDGNTIDPSEYRLRDRRYLEHRHGEWWTHRGVTVTYTCGQAPPEGGVESARQLTVQLGKLLADDADCQLPSTVTSRARQGNTTNYVTLLDVLKAGGTGLPLVDLWIKSVNPDGRRSRARVWSPDTEPRAYPQTTP